MKVQETPAEVRARVSGRSPGWAIKLVREIAVGLSNLQPIKVEEAAAMREHRRRRLNSARR